MKPRAGWRLAVAFVASLAAGPTSAADLGTGAPDLYAVPVQPSWYGGGHRWHGHHDWPWALDPHHAYATYGWKQPWVYAPRTLPYREYRPHVVMPTQVEPEFRRGAPAAWTKQWYRYCAGKHESFDPSTGLYVTASGNRRTCR